MDFIPLTRINSSNCTHHKYSLDEPSRITNKHNELKYMHEFEIPIIGLKQVLNILGSFYTPHHGKETDR